MLKKNILVPDDPAFREILESSFLQQQGFSFLAFHRLDQVIPLVEEEDPLLVVLPLDLEGLKGDDCCLRLKQDPLLRSTPVAMLVRSGFPVDLERGRAAGSDRYLYLPLDATQTVNTLCRLLRIVERAAARVDARFSLQFGALSAIFYEGVALNINAGGMFVSTKRHFPVNTLLDLELHWSELNSVSRCRGRVAWVNHAEWMKSSHLPPGMGVAFVDPPPALLQLIQAYVDAVS